MSTKIRLTRVGKKGQALYRVIVTDSRNSCQGGNFIEILGHFNPKKENSLIVEPDKVKKWIALGAIPSFTVRKLLGKAGILPPLDVSKLKKKEPKSKKGQEATAEQKEATPQQ